MIPATPSRLTFLRAGTALALIAAPLLAGRPAQAQSSNPGWFVPPAAQPQADAAKPAGKRAARDTAAPAPAPLPPPDADQGDDGSSQINPADLPRPSIPPVPDVPKGAPPPTAVIGVLGVPDVMRNANAASIVQRIIGARREKLQREADEAQAHWREMSQALQADAPKLTPDQGRERERALRERVIADRRKLAAENKLIDEAAAVATGQIERALVEIIKKVARAHGLNLVLHRSQVALNEPEFDITEEVIVLLNKTLPTVAIPPEGVDPAKLPKDWGSSAGSSGK